MSVFKSTLYLLLVLVLFACGSEQEAERFSPEQIEANNRGVALMGQYRNEAAREIFAELAEQDPDWLDVRVNEAIATLNRQQEGDEHRALAIVESVLEQQPDHARARYVAALMYFYLGDIDQALLAFRQVAGLQPRDPHVAYFTGQTLSQLGQFEQALAYYQRAIEQDPYLRSAYYGAALTLRRLGEGERAREKMAAYQRFENNPRAHLAEFRYTRMGPLAEAQAVGRQIDQVLAPVPEGEVFAPAQRLASLAQAAPNASLTTVDLSGDGRLDLFVAGGDDQPSWVILNLEEGWRVDTQHPLAGLEGVSAAAWGDLDNNGELQGFFCGAGGNRLLTRTDGQWAAAEGASDLQLPARCRDAALFDADHDGDLDIFVANADAPNELLNNNLDGSFRRLSEETNGLFAGPERGSRQVLAADLDGDRDADIVIIHDHPPHQVFRNDRLWRYEDYPGFDAFRAAPLIAVSAGDLNADGQLALVSVDASGLVQAWTPGEDEIWRPEALHQARFDQADSLSLAVADFRGDGRPDILLQHSAGFSLLDARGERLLEEQRELVALIPVQLDVRRGPSLVGLSQEGELLLWSPGPGRHDFLQLAPTGKTDRADGMRSNASGIGTGVVMRVGSRWMLADTYDRHSAPGQSLQPLAIGLAGSDRADFVQLFWTDGVMQTEMDLAAGQLHSIAEQQRQLASCPVLFAWNGERYEFVSDLLGVAGIGFFLEPGQYSDPRPWEYFKFPHGSIAVRDDGRYAIKIAEPMEEIAYIDTARLHIYDLPEDWAVTLDERMFTGGGPYPTGEAVFYRQSAKLRPVRAVNDRGEEVTEMLQQADFNAAPPGKLDRRFLGRLASDHVLTLEFDQVINPPGSEPVLVAHGWVEYPYSQTLFAAWQASADYRPASLEAKAGGQWHTVYEQFGYPAGMPREMSLPLADLPEGTTALRLSGNWEIYWDSIAVVHAEPAPAEAVISSLDIELARLAKTGFARRDTLDQRLPYYDYEDRSPFWDTKYPSGFYTALGPVEELVQEQNNAFAIFGPGEELHLEFEAPAEPPAGSQRTVVLEVRGYAKDMDLYTLDGETVGPIPGPGDQRREALHQQYKTRFQGGR